jgi:NAD(P)-dependent dehydrogenase (short-subunit alcohol dehydrogenase family)
MANSGHEELGLAGKSAVVVGSSGGWGRGVALALASVGARVVVNGRNPESVTRVVEEIRSAGGNAEGCAVAVDAPEGAQALTDFATDRFGSIDVLVNSTGGKVTGTILDITAADFDQSVDIQLKAPFLMTHYVAIAMVGSGTKGKIINMAGGAAVRPLYAESLHCATKGGLLAATWTWAQELAEHGITVNAARGGVRSPGTEPLIANIRSKLKEHGLPDDPSDRELGFYEAEEAAPLVVWLASARADRVTGQFVGIDGGKVTIWDLPASTEVHREGGWDVGSLDAVVGPLLEAATVRSSQQTQVIDALKYVGSSSGQDQDSH